MKINLTIKTNNNIPQIPPMDGEDGYCLHYLKDGVVHGGYSFLSDGIDEFGFCRIQLDVSEEVFNRMLSDDSFEVKDWEVVLEELENHI
jgi:hypothetical protein